MDGDVFVLSDMTIDVHRFPHGDVIGFNGTTEWALDSIEQRHSVWLPSEDQLRDKLAGTFRTLTRHDDCWEVAIEVSGRPRAFQHADPAEAYGLALLYLITGEVAAA